MIYLGIGSNIGNREINVKKALASIKKKCRIVKTSSLYETEPIEYKDQDWFLNCVVEIKTELNPFKLFDFLQSIEKTMGRIKKIKNGPRLIDLDILFYDDHVINTEKLTLPHPRMTERLFVLTPLNEISPSDSLKELIKQFKQKCKYYSPPGE